MKNNKNSIITFIRHGESLSNLENRFTGWLDVDLTNNGYINAYKAGLKLYKLNYNYDICYTSLLKRSIKTAWGILDGMSSLFTPIKKIYNLNERHYGKLSGLNKSEGFNKFGKENVLNWLNEYENSPPSLSKKEFKNFYYNKNQYKNVKKKYLPFSESLNDVLKRVSYFWEKIIKKNIKSNKNILIVSHSNVLKILLNYINNEKSVNLIPNTTPINYEFDINFNKIKNYVII